MLAQAANSYRATDSSMQQKEEEKKNRKPNEIKWMSTLAKLCDMENIRTRECVSVACVISDFHPTTYKTYLNGWLAGWLAGLLGRLKWCFILSCTVLYTWCDTIRYDVSMFKAVKQVIAIRGWCEQNNETSTNMLSICLNYVKQIGLIKQKPVYEMPVDISKHKIPATAASASTPHQQQSTWTHYNMMNIQSIRTAAIRSINVFGWMKWNEADACERVNDESKLKFRLRWLHFHFVCIAFFSLSLTKNRDK